MMKNSLFLCMAMVFMSCASQEKAIALWPEGKIPNQIPSEVEEVHHRTDILRISKVQTPTLAVFLPPKEIATGQAMLIFPGGGYSILAYDWEGTDIAEYFNKKGIACFVVKYRLPSDETQTNKHYVPLIDAQRAIRMVRSRAEEWGVAENKIGVIGFSAGGHLASTLGTKFDKKVYEPIDTIDQVSARPDFMVLMYPVITMAEYTHAGSRDNLLGKNASKQRIVEFSSELHISKDTPPAYLVHAMDDTVVPRNNSEYYWGSSSVEREGNSKGALYLYETGGHGFGLAQDDQVLRKWPINVLEWINSLEIE